MNAIENYLRLPTAYCDFLGGICWASAPDAIEYADGGTFVFHEQIALFVEGFGRGRRLIHFGFILHLLDLFRDVRPAPGDDVARLREAFYRSGASLRNAGAFAAALCVDVPGVPEDVDVRQICARLREPSSWFVAMLRDTFSPAELPPLNPAVFEAQVRRALEAYSTAEVDCWLRFGAGPVKEAGRALARQLSLPRSLGGVLAALLERPRLAGARPFVAQMVSALTLPPRRLDLQDLPMGGYADVTTRGHVDQLLLSQFALDEWDFFRRFAEKELLYFRREEPHAQTRRELVVLFDQGVRTWGDVRLVLSAAVLALGKQASAGGLTFRLATTAEERANEHSGAVDPLAVDEETLAALVEGSDLTRHPGLALERLLEERANEARDIVLLSHPRNLAEPDVAAAARRLPAADRLFALSLDARGAARLVEMKRGQPVPIRQFRVDFSQVLVPAPTAACSWGPPGWQGDIEPIPSPFRFGLSGAIGVQLFDFDYGAEWLLTGTSQGMLCAWQTDGSAMEVLPRPLVNSAVMTRYEAIVGVAGGFVVVGYLADHLAVVHYDFVNRRCTAQAFRSSPNANWRWSYSREHHTFLTCWRDEEIGYAFDLTSGQCMRLKPHETRPVTWTPSRAHEGWQAWWEGRLPVRNLPVFQTGTPDDKARVGFHLDPVSGEVEVNAMRWPPFTPRADGQPSLKGYSVLEAQKAGHTVAALVRHPHTGRGELRLFRGTTSALESAAYPQADREGAFKLSWDGERLARRIGDLQVQVLTVTDNPRPVFSTRRGGFPQGVELHLSSHSFYLSTAKRHHFFVHWRHEKLAWDHVTSRASLPAHDTFISAWPMGVVAAKNALPARFHADRARFVKAATSHVSAVVDCYGQVAILDAQENLVCMFFAFRDLLAAWMPDGTRLGPPHLTGGPPSPDAAERIGLALWQASERGKER